MHCYRMTQRTPVQSLTFMLVIPNDRGISKHYEINAIQRRRAVVDNRN